MVMMKWHVRAGEATWSSGHARELARELLLSGLGCML